MQSCTTRGRKRFWAVVSLVTRTRSGISTLTGTNCSLPPRTERWNCGTWGQPKSRPRSKTNHLVTRSRRSLPPNRAESSPDGHMTSSQSLTSRQVMHRWLIGRHSLSHSVTFNDISCLAFRRDGRDFRRLRRCEFCRLPPKPARRSHSTRGSPY